jgi:copper resistance protein B
MKSTLNNKTSGLTLMLAFLALPPLATAQTSEPRNPDSMNNMPGMTMPMEPRQDRDRGNQGQPEGKPSGSGDNEAGEKSMNGKDMQHGAPNGMQPGAMPGMKSGSQGQGAMQGMKMGPMQGGSPPPDARGPNAYAEGTQRKPLHGMEMADDELFGRLLVNELEGADGRHEHGQNLDAEAWYGGDHDKVWIKAEGDRRSGRLDSLRTEALWDRVFATYWSTQLGIRHDTGQGTTRNWLAVGVQGLAPYWFETEATAYLGAGGAIALRGEVRYELLFTQRLILEPKLEANVYSKDDPSRGVGSGLSDLELGLRLRYEIRRQFAPYIGVSWKRKFGNTAGFAGSAGENVQATEAVAGVRFWF